MIYNFKQGRCLIFDLQLIFIYLLLLSYTGGCAYVRNRTERDMSSYENVVKSWTKTAKVYDELDTIILIDALYKNWTVRKTYIENLSKTNNISLKEKERLLNMEKEENKKINSFFLTVYTGKELWNDLNEKKSIWNIVLKDKKGNRWRPLKVKEIKYNELKIKKFYPFVTPWKKIYEIDFPKDSSDNAGQIILTISSMLGRVELRWEYSKINS